MKKLPTYLITIDDEYATDGEDLGIDKIAFTSNPAIKVKGMAFTTDTPKSLIFTDNLKYRIAAPIMIPMQIYRCDESEYYVQFTTDEIEKIHKKYMSKPHSELFNLEHTDEEVPAYALEVILVDSENKIKLIKDEYNIDVPMGTSFMVSQVTDKDYYASLVENDQIGFSIEGFLGLKLSELYNNTKIKQNEMIKQEFKLQDGSTLQLFEDGSTHIVLADLPVEEDKVIEDIKKDAKDEETMADEVPAEVAPAEAPAEAPAVAETYTKEQLDAKFDELYSLIADIKAKDVVEDVVDEVPMAMSLHDRFNAFVRFASTEE